jgi:lysozyme
MRSIPSQAIALVKDKEKLVLFVYDDAYYPPREVRAGDDIEGTLTAGYGHTGHDVRIGMVVTEAVADSWLSQDLNKAAGSLFLKIGSDIIYALTDNQYAALLDFVFNLGTGDPAKPEWTIWKRLKAKQFDQVPLEMAKFVNAGGKKLNGLVDRRNAEIGLWAVNEPGTTQVAIPSSVTRCSPTPPTPADPVPPSKSKGLLLGAAGAVAGAGPMFNQAQHAIEPYTSQSNYIQKLYGFLAILAAGCALAGLFYFWLQKRNARN